MKICRKCKKELTENLFNNSQLKLNKPLCKLCLKLYKKEYYKKNKEKINQTNKLYNQKESYKEYKKQHYLENRERYIQYKKQYYIDNMGHIKNKVSEYSLNRKKNDPAYLLKINISKQINIFLKKKNLIKCGSLLKYVEWNLNELYLHIENSFEDWMNWNNYGVYCKNTWDNNDKKTWKWQLDHIVPHSNFNYISMEDDEFKQCWSLNNLRPYSAKQNIIDGNRR